MDDKRKKDIRLTLTIEDINQHECFRDLSPEQKAELIVLVFEISLALYKIYGETNG